MLTSFKGIRIEFNIWEPAAVLCGLPWNRRIVVGPNFDRLPLRQQQAVLCHEVGHHRLRHLEKRWLMIPIFWTRFAAGVAVAQEFAADEYAVLHGYGNDLVAFLMRQIPAEKGGPFYPTHRQRISNIQRFIRETGDAIFA